MQQPAFQRLQEVIARYSYFAHSYNFDEKTEGEQHKVFNIERGHQRENDAIC